MPHSRPFWCFLLVLHLHGCFYEPPADPSPDTSSAHKPSGKPYHSALGKPGGQRVIGNTDLPDSFNPYLASDRASQAVTNQMFVGLVGYHSGQKKIVPELAKSWTVSEDGLRFEFDLHPGLKWSDGHPLTSKDIEFTYNQVINNPKIPNNYRDFWRYLPRFPQVNILSPTKIEFVLDKPFAPVLFNLLAPILPRHVFKDKIKEVPGEKNPPFYQMWGTTVTPNDVIVNGPWKLKNYKLGQQLILEANPHYHRKDAAGVSLPYLRQMIMLDVQDKNAALLKFLHQETDSYQLEPREYDTLKAAQDEGHFNIHNLGPNTSALFVMFNQTQARNAYGVPLVNPVKSKWFRNLKFRQALSHAIHKQGMIQSIYKGRAVPLYSHIHHQSPFFNTQLQDYGFNLKKAKALLQEAGFQRRGKQLYDAEGNPVVFDLTTNATHPERDAICGILKNTWRQLGIQVNYRPKTFHYLIHQIHNTFDWDAMVMGLSTSSLDPHFSSSRWRLDGRMHLFNMGHPRSWKGKPTQYQAWEQHMQNLYEKAALEQDFQTRKGLYLKAQELEHHNLPFLYLISELTLFAVDKKIKNMYPSILGGNGLNQINWNTYEQFIE